ANLNLAGLAHLRLPKSFHKEPLSYLNLTVPNSSEDFSLPEQLPTANEDKFPLLIQSDTTADELYAAAEVIEFGDSYEAPITVAATGSVSEGTATKKGRTVALSTKDIQKRKNDVKARTTLLLALFDEHQLRFKCSETLEKTFNRLHAIVSHLQFMDIEIEQDDLNQKFLTSLAPEWLMHTIKKSESNSKNMDFISSAKNSSWKEDVNTDSISTASTNVSPASLNIEAVSISQGTACAYIASQSSGSQIKFEDITQIDKDDIEEMDIKWNMALLSMRADRFRKKTRKKISIQGTDAPKALMAIDGVGWDWSFMENEEDDHALVVDEKAPTEFALMAKTSAESEVFDNSLCFKNCLSQVEGRLVEFKNQEIKFCKKIRVLEFSVECKTNQIKNLTNELELLKKENEGLESKLIGFQSALKDLDSLLESQRLDKKKERPSPTIESTSDDAHNRNPSVPETEASPSTISSEPFIKFMKAADPPTVAKSDKKETVRKPSIKYVELVDHGSSWAKNNITHKSKTPRIVFHKTVRSQFRGPRVATVNRKFPTVNRKPPTVNRKFPTGNIKFSTADLGNKGKAVKASACWI
nr:hypothetical protein [Tanacetum cinerariifolium]